MAYNYEYPYVSPEQYNDDWLINEWLRLKCEWEDFNQNVVGKWDEFLIEAQQKFNAFKAEVQKIQSDFETDITEQWTAYRINLTNAWTKYKKDLTDEWDVFRRNMLSLQNDFETQMTNNYQQFVNQQTQAFDTFTSDMETRYTSFAITINDRINEFTTKTDNDINDMMVEIADFKTYVNNWIDNLDITAEVSSKIDDMVSSGEFANTVNPNIINAANAWLNSHVTNPTNPPLDKSLLLSNTAAESAHTGYRLLPLLHNCDLIITTDDFIYTDQGISAVDGSIKTLIGYKTTDRIFYPAESGQLIHCAMSGVSEGSVYSIGFFDYDNHFISGHAITDSGSVQSIAVPNGTAYVRACMGNATTNFAYIVGTYDYNMANFKLRSRHTSATAEQQRAIDTVNGMAHVVVNHDSNMWDVGSFDLVDSIDVDFILDTYESNTDQLQLALRTYTDDTYILKILNNMIIMQLAGNNTGVISLTDQIYGKHHMRIDVNGRVLVISVDGNLLGNIHVPQIHQVGLHLYNSINSWIDYKVTRLTRVTKLLIVEAYTTLWMINPEELLNQLDELHSKYDTNILLSLTYQQNTGIAIGRSFERLPSNILQAFSNRHGWLKLSILRLAETSTSLLSGAINSFFNYMRNHVGRQNYSPLLMAYRSNCDASNFDRSVANNQTYGAILTATENRELINNYGLSNLEVSTLKLSNKYTDYGSNLEFYQSICYCSDESYYNDGYARIRDMSLYGTLNTFIIEGAINGNVPILDGTTLTRIDNCFKLYDNVKISQ